MTPFITKGSRIVARWFQANQACLAGYQMKTGATQITLSGIVRHLRGDDPADPREVLLYIEPDGEVPDTLSRTRPYGCECEGHDRLVEVKIQHVVGVLESESGSCAHRDTTRTGDVVTCHDCGAGWDLVATRS